MFEFARKKYRVAQGEYHEPGLQEISVRNFTGRQVLVGAVKFGLSLADSLIFCPSGQTALPAPRT